VNETVQFTTRKVVRGMNAKKYNETMTAEKCSKLSLISLDIE